MFRRLVFLLCLLLMLAPSAISIAQEPQGLPVDLPRESLFVADQIFRYGVIENYNLWVPGSLTPHRHALMMETLWYADQETGERLYGAAVSDPEYNDDFTEMTVRLRDNLTWSDGVPFTSADLVFTVETLMANPDLSWSADLNTFVEFVEATDDYTVVFTLKEANPRFHFFFETRWNGVYIMPKHIWENVDDPVTFTNPDPVVLGTYVPIDADPNGFWELFQRREDWENTSAGIITGNPGPEYVLTIFYGDSTRKAIAMSRGELDVAFDYDFEAFQSVIEETTSAQSWYPDFPWAYPNELNSRYYGFNVETDPLYANKDVRWALALTLDAVAIQTEYIGGVAKISVLPGIPTTPLMTELYFDPMEEWLTNLEIEIGDGEMFAPYDPTIPDQIAEWAASEGYTVPGNARDVFGSGWWAYSPEVAERLLTNNGFTRDGSGNWLQPDGQPWVIDLMAAVDEPDAFRMAQAAADMWGDFGIDVNVQGVERSVWDQSRFAGQQEVTVPWDSFPDPSGDIWQGIRGFHSDFYVPNGEASTSRGGDNDLRIQDPMIDQFIDELGAMDPQSPDTVARAQEFLQYWTENMLTIQVLSFKKFVTWDSRYWTGFPTSESPTYMPLYWFMGGKFAFQSLTPVGA